MAEPFKNIFSLELIAGMGGHLQRAATRLDLPFDAAAFNEAAAHDLDTLELKQRSVQIQAAMTECLPTSFPEAARVIAGSLHPHDVDDRRGGGGNEDGLRGMALMPVADFVAQQGQEHFEVALDLLKEVTKRFSSEFAIRPFLIAQQERTLAELSLWASDPNQHVRRLVSEGTRPRLPWGTRLASFVRDPTPVLPLLEALKDDPEEYVRRSVANNLNDIAKDHPDLVAEIAARWLKGASKERAGLVRHACRTLVKKGHPGALAALGFGPPRIVLERLEIMTPQVKLGGTLSFGLAIRSDAPQGQNLVIDYVIHHRKANGKTSPKVFKWKTIRLAAGAAHEAERRHAVKPISTRRYYSGEHLLEVQVNGRVLGRESFDLEV